GRARRGVESVGDRWSTAWRPEEARAVDGSAVGEHHGPALLDPGEEWPSRDTGRQRGIDVERAGPVRERYPIAVRRHAVRELQRGDAEPIVVLGQRDDAA